MSAQSTEEIVRYAQSVLSAEAASLQACGGRIGPEFAEAVRVLDGASLILLSGVGKSGIVAKKIAATLSSVGHPAVFLHPVEALHGDLGVAIPGSVCVMLSRSGSTSELLALLPVLQHRHIPVVGLIGRMDSALARSVNVCLDASVDTEADGMNIVPTNSTSLAMALGDALALSLMKGRNFQAEDFARNHPYGQLGRNLHLQVAHVMHSQAEHLPLCQPDTSFSQALIESSSKALGCVCVVDANARLLGIITDGDVRRALQRHSEIKGLHAIDVMTSTPLCATPEMLLQEALNIMEQGERQIGVLPVVDAEHHCIGVLRLHDILQAQR